jgi:ATP-dependent DNA helicase RecG
LLKFIQPANFGIMSERRTSFFDTKIEYLKGVGPSKAEILNKELTIFTFGDLIEYYPFRHEDRTQFHRICDLNDTMVAAQIKGRLRSWEKVGESWSIRRKAVLKSLSMV